MLLQLAAGNDPTSKITEFQEMSKGGIATLTDANFERLVRSANRPYHTFVVFNARDPQYQCALCGCVRAGRARG